MGLKESGLRGSLRSVSTGVGIPDSEADQKLTHRWLLDEDSDPFVDLIGDKDGTNDGTTQVEGGWINGAAREGNGTDQKIDIGTINSFVNQLGGDWAIAFSMQTTDTGFNRIIGNETADQTSTVRFFTGLSDAEVGVQVEDENDNQTRVVTDENYANGNPHRVVLNCPDATNASSYDFWINQSDVADSVDLDQGTQDNFADSNAFAFFGRPDESNYWAGVLDDICFYDSSLTNEEIQSYSNPWP